MATPHIRAEKGDFAPAVLMPGDPKRAERIAKQLFDQPRLVTDVRGILGFTGEIDGKPLSVMASGMGIPSIGIYSYELFSQYDVQRIIRVGTCGGIAPQAKVGNTVIGIGAHTDSNFNQVRIPGINFSATASFNLIRAAVEAAGDDQNVHVGPIVSRDHFYLTVPGQVEALAEYGVLGVEMEAAGLYGIAAELGKEALTVLTVSDHLLDHSQDMSAEDRETKFQTALNLAVAAALS